MNTGAPMIAVRMDIGISAEVALLAKVSITIIRNAPAPALTGITERLLLPPIIRDI